MYLSQEVPVYVNRISESFHLEQHRHEFIELNYVSEGKGFHYIEGNRIPVVKGDLFFLPVGVSHVFRPTTPTPEEGRLIVYNCLFNETFAMAISRCLDSDHEFNRIVNLQYPDQTWFHIHDLEGGLQQSFNSMFEEFQQRRSNYILLLQVEIIRLLIHMKRIQDNPLGTSYMPKEAFSSIDMIANRIRRQPKEVLTRKQYAVEIGISERHFQRLFKERFSMTFLEFVHKSRIELSCELLRTTTEKISSIAQQSGYKDIKFYNQLFKRLTGLSSHTYRTQTKAST